MDLDLLIGGDVQVLLGEVYECLDYCQGREDPLLRLAEALGEQTFPLMLSKGERSFGFAANNINDRLSLDKINAAIEEGTLGEFAGLGKARPLLQNKGKNSLHNQRPAMTLYFQDILAGIGMGAPHEYDHCFVETVGSNGVDNGAIIKTVAD